MANFPASIPISVDVGSVLHRKGNGYAVSAPVGGRGLDLGVALQPLAASPRTIDKDSEPDRRNFGASLVEQELGDIWFEIIHVFPTSFALGNILSTFVDTITIYNAFRTQSNTLDTFNNLAGDGVTVSLPVLPITFEPQSGATYTLTVSTSGPPTIDGTLDFGFNLYTIQVALTGSRVVIFPYRPEAPLPERLEFLTEIYDKKDGSESRVSNRVFPRQIFEFELFRDEGQELEQIDNLIYDWHARNFGVPVWIEPTVTTAALSNGDTVLPVKSTANADWRVGGLGIIIQDDNTFDALEVQAISANTVTFASPIGNDYPAGTEVMPLRIARITNSRIDADRAPVGLGTRKILFEVIDNDLGIDFGDDSAFILSDADHPLNGLRVLEDINAMRGERMRETFERKITVIDSLTGAVFQDSTWDRGKRSHSKGFVTRNRSRLWEARRLVHALKGRQGTFWISTFYKNFEPTQPILIGTTSFIVNEVGYGRFVQNRKNRNILAILDNQGRVQARNITGAVDLGNGTEQISVDSPWEFTLSPEEIVRISTYAEVRLANDTVEIEHLNSNGEARIFLPITEVF